MNYKNYLKLLPLISLFFNFAEAKNNFIWEIKSEKGTVFLLGSIHVAKKEIYPLDDYINQAYSKSDFLVVEANINNADPEVIKSMAYLPKGKTIDSVLKKENAELLKAKFKDLKIPSFAYKEMKPWMAVMLLTQVIMQKNGFDLNLGIDKYFLDKTPKEKILELESVDEQLNLLNSFSEQNQDEFVEYSLKDFDNSLTQVDSMFLAWKNGDIQLLENITKIDTDDKKYDVIIDKLLYNRNFKMTKKIEDFLNSEKTYFVVVGAGHIIGEKGLIDILSKTKKYKIEQK